MIARGRDGSLTPAWFDLHDKGFPNNQQEEWFTLQANYEFNEVEPDFDFRRNPGVEHMRKAGQEVVTVSGIRDIMHMWPTYNKNTDITCLMVVEEGIYEDVVWLDPPAVDDDERKEVFI